MYILVFTYFILFSIYQYVELLINLKIHQVWLVASINIVNKMGTKNSSLSRRIDKTNVLTAKILVHTRTIILRKNVFFKNIVSEMLSRIIVSKVIQTKIFTKNILQPINQNLYVLVNYKNMLQ